MTTEGSQQMLMHQKTMFDHCYCIKSFCRLKTLEKRLEKSHFVLPIMARKSMTPVPEHFVMAQNAYT